MNILRREALRAMMNEERLGGIILTNNGPHGREARSARWTDVAWLTDIDMEEATVAMTPTQMALWTRKEDVEKVREQICEADVEVLQAEGELPSAIARWLGQRLCNAASKEVGIDGAACDYATVESLIQSLRREGGLTLRTNLDMRSCAGSKRENATHARFDLKTPTDGDGSIAEKMERIRRALRLQHADGTLLSATTDIAWALNLVSSDGNNSRLPDCHLLIDASAATLFIDEEALTPSAIATLKDASVKTASYVKVDEGLDKYFEYNILLNPQVTSYRLYKRVKRTIVPATLSLQTLIAQGGHHDSGATTTGSTAGNQRSTINEKTIKKPSGCLAAIGWALLIIGAIIAGMSLLGLAVGISTLTEPDEPHHADMISATDSLGIGRLPSGEWFDIDSISGDTIIVETPDPFAYYPTKHGKAEIGIGIAVVFLILGAVPFSIGLALVIYYNNRSRRAWEQQQKALKEQKEMEKSQTRMT